MEYSTSKILAQLEILGDLRMDPVPVVDVHRFNAGTMLPVLYHAISRSTFVAIDIEFSGIGGRGVLGEPDIQTRYQKLAQVRQAFISSDG